MDAEHGTISTDDVLDASQETQETQQQTQSTQQASQQTNVSVDSHLWGYLQPCSSTLTRIDFWKIHPRYTIGRNTEHNQVVLPGFKVSNLHCTITWDGSDQPGSSVIVRDLSSNGTFINGVRVGKNQTRILREGNEIAFGTSVPQFHNGGLEDYRFVYRHTAAGPPTTGLYAHYDLGTELGKGSFATVMKAVSRKDGKWYAVKIIQESRHVRSAAESHAQPAVNTRNKAFAREISIMEGLDHPNICKLKEVFYQDNNDINLVLELVEGGDLLEYILSHGALAEPDAQHFTYQICDALSYIHSKGITHRDLKPENVLLTRDTPPMVKVADFGLAKVVDSLTMLRTMCGTPSYLAPEVVKQGSMDGYDNLVDSWSVGVIVFSMLTNANPFIEDEAQKDIRARILHRRIEWSCISNHSFQAQSFIRNLLEENPQQRMTLTHALQHQWLLSYTPIYKHQIIHPPLNPSIFPQDDFVMLTAVPQSSFLHPGLQSMQVEASRSFSNDSLSTNAPNNTSRAAPLQRRSYILSQAAEEGSELVGPTWEMITAADRSHRYVHSADFKGHKRMHSELTPLSEDEFENNQSTHMTNVPSVLSTEGSVSKDLNPEKEIQGKAKAHKPGTVDSALPVNQGGSPGQSQSGGSGGDDTAQLRRLSRHQKLARHC